MYRFYYNRKTGGDVLYCVINPLSYPDKVKKTGNVAALYHGDDRVGINFLDISQTMKIKAEGMIPFAADEFLKLINHMLENAGEESLPQLDSSFYKIARVGEIEEHPLDDKKVILHLGLGNQKLDTVTRYSNIKVGDCVVVALDGCLKVDGTPFAAHKERNIPIDCEVCSMKDLGVGEEDKLALIVEEGAAGEDFFLR